MHFMTNFASFLPTKWEMCKMLPMSYAVNTIQPHSNKIKPRNQESINKKYSNYAFASYLENFIKRVTSFSHGRATIVFHLLYKVPNTILGTRGRFDYMSST